MTSRSEPSCSSDRWAPARRASAARVAKALGVGFFDTDIAVVRAHGPIEAIFAEHGEAHFRALERAAVHAGARDRRRGRRSAAAPCSTRDTQADLAAHRVVLLTVDAAGRRRPHPRHRPAAAAGRRRHGAVERRSTRRAGRSTSELADATFDTSHGPLQHVVDAIVAWAEAAIYRRNAHDRRDHDLGARRRHLRHHGGTRHPLVPRRSPPAGRPQGARDPPADPRRAGGGAARLARRRSRGAARRDPRCRAGQAHRGRRLLLAGHGPGGLHAHRCRRRLRRGSGHRPRRVRRGDVAARRRGRAGADDRARHGRRGGRRQDRGEHRRGQEPRGRLLGAARRAVRPRPARLALGATSSSPGSPRWSRPASSGRPRSSTSSRRIRSRPSIRTAPRSGAASNSRSA